MLLTFMIWQETLGSGIRIAIARAIKVHLTMVQQENQPAVASVPAWCAAARGFSNRGGCVLPNATASMLLPAFSTSGFVSPGSFNLVLCAFSLDGGPGGFSGSHAPAW